MNEGTGGGGGGSDYESSDRREGVGRGNKAGSVGGQKRKWVEENRKKGRDTEDRCSENGRRRG